MKVGLLSYHRNYNYGWNLQCYALLSVLKSLGHDVMLIDKRRFEEKTFLSMLKCIMNKLCLKKQNSYEKNQNKRGRNVFTFFEKYIVPRTFPIMEKGEYKNLPQFDAFVVGSDQVWRSKLVRPIADYYFDFVSYPAVFISYAASFGVDYPEYSPAEVLKCGELIKRFSAISVRESSGKKLIKDVYGWKCNPEEMPDPTILLNREVYENIANRSKNKEEIPQNCLFSYVLDITDDKKKIMDFLETQTTFPHYKIFPNIDPEKAVPSVEDWLCGFMKSKFVFTDSFHGCVFSLIFGKPFLVYGNEERGLARFQSLLGVFTQENRLINSSADINKANLLDLIEINNRKIDLIQSELQRKAIDFLSLHLNLR